MKPIVNVLCVTGGATLAIALLLVSSSGVSAPQTPQEMSKDLPMAEYQPSGERVVAAREGAVEARPRLIDPQDRAQGSSRGHHGAGSCPEVAFTELTAAERSGLRNSLELLLPKYVPADAVVVSNVEPNGQWVVQVEHADVDAQVLNDQIRKHLLYLRSPGGGAIELVLTVVHPSR